MRCQGSIRIVNELALPAHVKDREGKWHEANE
jgi:hypothetical protein